MLGIRTIPTLKHYWARLALQIARRKGIRNMNDWLHDLPVIWMAFTVFGFTYLVAAAVYALVMVLAVGERVRSFKAISPGMLPPLGIIFGLFVAFTAAQVWNDNERATREIDREASALRTVVVLAGNFPGELASSFPGEREKSLRALIRRYIEEATTHEWRMMAKQTATLTATPQSLAEALQLTLALTPDSEGQKIAQREMVSALGNAFDARRQRIIVSQTQVNLVKWVCLFVQAVCALLAIAMVHSDNRLASTISMAIFATGVAAAVLLIVSHDRPFIGELSVRPDPLLQVIPAAEVAETRTCAAPSGRNRCHPQDWATWAAMQAIPNSRYATFPRYRRELAWLVPPHER